MIISMDWEIKRGMEIIYYFKFRKVKFLLVVLFIVHLYLCMIYIFVAFVIIFIVKFYCE